MATAQLFAQVIKALGNINIAIRSGERIACGQRMPGKSCQKREDDRNLKVSLIGTERPGPIYATGSS